MVSTHDQCGIARSRDVSRTAHQAIGQIRTRFKDNSTEAYYLHCWRVGESVTRYWSGPNETIQQFLDIVLGKTNDDVEVINTERTDSIRRVLSMIYAAYLHDTLEDTKITREDIRDMFGELAMRYVVALTSVTAHIDKKTISRSLRKSIDLCHFYNLDEDIISDVCFIKTYDFGDNWVNDFKYCENRTYLATSGNKLANRVRKAVEYMLMSVVFINGIRAKNQQGHSMTFKGTVDMLVHDLAEADVSEETVQAEIQRQINAWLDNSLASDVKTYEGVDTNWMYVKGTKETVVHAVWDELQNMQMHVSDRFKLIKREF